jgi:GR25 family glycosyltransferase involved in LPS biosynthesis
MDTRPVLFIALGIIAFVLLMGLMFVHVPMCPPGYYVDGTVCVALGDTASKPTWSQVLHSPAYIINLDRSPERLATARQRIAEAGYTDVRRFRGVDGKKDDLPTLWAEHYPHGTVFTGHTKAFSSLGQHGCMLSWLNLLKHIRDGPDDIVTVFEDDIVFRESWSLARTFYDETPSNFDMVYMGCTTVYAPGTNRIMSVPCFCTHALLFTRTGAGRVYDYLVSSPVQYPVDEMFYDHSLLAPKQRSYRSYVWMYKDSNYTFVGDKGLVYQDDVVFPSTIKLSPPV